MRVQEHIRNIHESADIEQRCATCGFVSTTPRALKKHIFNMHKVVRKHKCDMCEKAFKRPQDIKVSIETTLDPTSSSS
ncbi:Zinc finger Y-chromosomal protein 2 [Eumeta japonica]|uniref:Zinc finger Y-chromosomal protein 2 n=1 Tax=Eumeta variegata TaxID=151549 RepID=A0A4C1SKX6_EUMVA|nr:Zinc finger Y-chromosomal protein 2 [Eumeta japonica]